MDPLPSAPENKNAGWFRRLGAAGPVAIVLSFWPPLGGFVLLATLTQFGPWLRSHGVEGMAIYFLFIGALMGLSFVPTYSCAILAGWAFGFAAGFPLAVVTITVASLIAYAIGRWIARDRVLEVVRARPKWNAVFQALLGRETWRTFLVVTLLRIPPTSPFAIANFVLAAGRVRLWPYTFGTLVGIMPRTAVAAYAAAQLEQLRFKDVANTWVVVAGIVATLIVCAVIGQLANQALRRVTGYSEAA
ncbi:MAG: VTT domain-containing protein [Opitutaceae bacterium]